jgi:hypothetical protein
MIKMIQAGSILSLVAAGFLWACCALHWLHDSATEPTTTSSAIEQFLRSRPGGRHGDSNQPSPLVQQAQVLALYLNPPQATAAPTASATATASVASTTAVNRASAVTPPTPIRPPASSAKFELHGISYYRQKPEQSMALVLEPGGMRHWVHPGEQLGHLAIERIDGNSVVCRDGAQTQIVALAPREAITQYARAIKGDQTPAAPKQAQNKDPGPQVPPPAPGIRQMPASQVAALLGQSS